MAGCANLTPFETILQTVPASEFVQLDGQWIHFERAGSGPPLVLIHGFGGSTYSWREVLADLAADHDVIAIDLNGFGYTQRPTSLAAYSLAGQVNLVHRLLERLEVGPATFVGHSYGAGIALGLATRHPQRVSALVLVDGGVLRNASEGFILLPPLQPLASCFVQMFLLNEDTIRNALLSAVVDPALITDQVVYEYLVRLRVDGVDRAIRGLTSPATDVLAIDLAGISQPALVIWGEQDSVIPSFVGERVARDLPDARLVIFPATGHLPMEEKPAAFLAEVRSFLNDVFP